MSRSPAKSGNATMTKSLKEKWLSIVQSTIEKGEKGIGGSSTITLSIILIGTSDADLSDLGAGCYDPFSSSFCFTLYSYLSFTHLER